MIVKRLEFELDDDWLLRRGPSFQGAFDLLFSDFSRSLLDARVEIGLFTERSLALGTGDEIAVCRAIGDGNLLVAAMAASESELQIHWGARLLQKSSLKLPRLAGL
ncbi:hypothetical protein [Methylovirgula sp. HY1]|uniref:hypothetical protein n=1 Tax=Methylovirgula sp. HY1 TaxID=2822761 RepID=UPI001C5BDF7A|nr:hypothetical protein [Methylovirgula sp. HY1]